MRLSELDYALPSELIAQEPAPDRTQARLMVIDRQLATRRDASVRDLPTILRAGDVLVLNDTRVVPARVRGRRPSGGRLEVLFVRPCAEDAEWETIVRGAPRAGERVHFPDASGEWVAPLGDGGWRVRMAVGGAVTAWLERVGEMPLPPYVRRPGGPSAADVERYQTVYARAPGAVAAPTAGLHFTPELLATVADAGVETVFLTLHVGPGTFQPIRTDDLGAHRMAPERYDLPPESARRIATARAAGRRIVAVGTTTVRALESAAAQGPLAGGSGEAELFIAPGHAFRVVDALLTNFHLPRSTLLALVVAFAGWHTVRAAYEEAVARRYRFYSYGDAMLIT